MSNIIMIQFCRQKHYRITLADEIPLIVIVRYISYLLFVDSQKTFHYSAPVTAKSVAGIATPDESNRHITHLRLCVLSTAIPTLWWLGEAAFGWAGVIRFRWLQPCPVHLHELQPHGGGLKT